MLTLARPESLPAVNECLLCVRCSATYRVLHHTDGGRGVQLWPSHDREVDAHAEMPWCSECGTMEEREKGIRFNRGVPTRQALRAALAEALNLAQPPALWTKEAQAKAARIAELRKLVTP